MVAKLAVARRPHIVEVQRRGIPLAADNAHGAVDGRLGDEVDAVNGQDAQHVSRSPGVGPDGVGHWVCDVVARLVVARVLLGAGAREETADRLEDLLLEGDVVSAAGEADGRHLQALLHEPLDKQPLDDLGSGGSTGRHLAGVAIKDSPETTRDHVKIDVSQKLVDLDGSEVSDVETGSPKTVLLSSPPRKTDLEVGGEVVERSRELQIHRRARAVVVDARADDDRVQVRAELEDVVGVAVLGLSKDVGGDSLLDQLDNGGVGNDLLSSLDPGAEFQARSLINERRGHVIWARRGKGAGRQLRGAVVVDDNGHGAGGSGGSELAGKGGLVGAEATLNQDDFALDVEALVVGGGAPVGALGTHGERQGKTLLGGARGVGQGDGAVGGVVDGDGGCGGVGEESGEVLLPGVEALELGQLAKDPIDRGVVAGVAKGSISAVGVGNVVEDLQVAHQAVPRC